MIYFFGQYLQQFFGPARLLQSYTILLSLALAIGFFVTVLFLPKFYDMLPHDRGREFTLSAEAAKGKPTGSGVIFISIFVIDAIFFVPMTVMQAGVLLLVWLTMLSGFLDDRSTSSWGEYRKALIDLAISLATAFLLYYFTSAKSPDGKISFWLPFFSSTITVQPAVYIAVCVMILWASINTTNCTDGVDGLSSVLVLIALLTIGATFYFILGNKDISKYLLVPHLESGASWAVMTFALAGVLMGYLWHNAYPSHVLMGDAGSRALGYFIGVCVMVSGNPFLIFSTSSVIFVNGGLGLFKVAFLRFFHIHIFKETRFPLHDHMRKNRGWSPTQVLIKFMIVQLLVTLALLGILFKVR